MDVSKMANAGWKAKIGLEEGVSQTYQWFLENVDVIKIVSTLGREFGNRINQYL
jgi:GDP-L-fucose synthase